jgi:hypothetical protein
MGGGARRLCAAAALGLAIAATSVPIAHASHTWEWADTIWTPRVDTLDDPDALARCDFLLWGDGARSRLGYMITLPSLLSDGTKRFTLVDGNMGGLTEGANHPDVTFFTDLGTCTTPGTVLARHFGSDPKEGGIPEGARYALVTIHGDATSTFIFESGVPVAH